jgi:hypothetical protein
LCLTAAAEPQSSSCYTEQSGNTATTYRIPRTPSAFNGNTTTGFGSIGYFVDGVALFIDC